MPQLFGRYELRELLGRGGMGEVYRAYDTERQREVALKLLPDHLASDEQFAARFTRESLLAAQLNEPHIVPIHDFGDIGGRLFIDMRLVEGDDLGTVLKTRGALAPRIAVDVVRQVASALDAAHARGLVHRDVKPSNVMLTALPAPAEPMRQPPFAYLVDFGIARSSQHMTQLTTNTSSTVGTIAYMAPERISGDEFDQRSDVYALACVLYEALTGTMPFQGDTVAMMFAHMSKDVPRPSAARPGIPDTLDRVVAKGMAKNPDERYRSASELAGAAYAAVDEAGHAPTAPAAPPGFTAPAAFPPPTGAPVTSAAPSPPFKPHPNGPAYPGPPPPTTRHVAPPGPYGAAPAPPNRPGAAYQTGPGDPGRSRGRKRLAAVAAVVAAAAIGVGVPLAVSGDDGGGSAGPTGSGSRSSSPAVTGFAKGGTLYYALGITSVRSWDPQRNYLVRDWNIASRLFERTLTQLAPGASGTGISLRPDLATDTGHSSADSKTWTFTLKTGVKWQDGSTVTCADVKYGISRRFATDVITGGPSTPIDFLDIPTGIGGVAYQGPYDRTGQALYDQAVACSGQTITFHLKRPVPDFNYAVSLPVFAPFKQSVDRQDDSNFAVFSNGPYRLDGTWVDDSGGTFVRNQYYDAGTDDPTVRRALPDKIVFDEGSGKSTVYNRLLDDTGSNAYLVTGTTPEVDQDPQVSAIASRFTNRPSFFTDFLMPNTSRLSPAVRQALALATDRAGFVAAQGGRGRSQPAYGIVPPGLGASGGYRSFRALDVPDAGDAARAKAVLTQAKIKMPVPIRLVYNSDAPVDVGEGAKALAASWGKAGFAVTVDDPFGSSYFDIVGDPAMTAKWDITITAVGPDWPSASTMLPFLFDSRVNLTKTSNGADFGRYADPATNAAIDKADATADATARNQQWGALDEALAKSLAYIPLDTPTTPRLHGSKVVNYTESDGTYAYPDLGQIGVKV